MSRYNAIVVNTVERGPGQMTGMGDGSPVVDLLDTLTGGQITSTQSQLQTLELALKISIAASVISGAVAILLLAKKGL